MKAQNLLLIGALLLTACGDDGETTPDIQDPPASKKSVDPPVKCKGDFCGESRFLAAVPSSQAVLINFGRGGSSSQALADISPAFEATQEHVSEINDTIDDVFAAIEEIASTEPTTATDSEHVWEADADGSSFTLVISTDDNTQYDFELDVEDDSEAAGVTGTVVLNDDDEKESFEFQIDYDALGDFGNETGSLAIRAIPSDDGVWEITYGLEAADEEAEVFETTRYWVIDETGGAIEYTVDAGAGEDSFNGDVYVRWDDDGGRFDSSSEGENEDGEFVAAQTDCWDAVGGQTFAAEVLFVGDEKYAVVDGSESDCIWEIDDAHPDLDGDILAFFSEESWEDYAELDEIPDGENNLNNGPGECADAADAVNEALDLCGFEMEPDLCSEPDATIACADAIAASDDACDELDTNPDCF